MPLTIISNNLHLRISKNTLIIDRLRKNQKARLPGNENNREALRELLPDKWAKQTK